MDRKKYEKISIDIANIIAMDNPIIDVDGLIKALNLREIAGEEYVAQLKKEAKVFDPKDFNNDPYIKNIKVSDVKLGDFFLTNATYEKGELFQYDEPDLVPKLGYFTGKVDFPTIYEGIIPWMSVCPSEMNSMKKEMEEASGKVLVLGLGLGYYPYIISQRDDVTDITIVEFQPEIIKLFEENIFPQFNKKDKIKIVQADAIKFMMDVEEGEYDYIFSDIWENQFDGAIHYRKIQEHEARLKGTRFGYWIKDQIVRYIQEEDL
ncbi:MAG: hypothetical protein MJ146_05280 [Clostridia bacterium]|nr:hypothetical protein [Clostridia bacterium]